MDILAAAAAQGAVIMIPELFPRQADKALVRSGNTLVFRLFVLLKSAQNYAEGHAAMDPPAVNVVSIVNDIRRRNEEACLIVRGGHLFLGETRLKPDLAGFNAFVFMVDTMKRHYLGSITFSAAVSKDDVTRFAYLFRELEPIPSPQSFERFQQRMEQRSLSSLEISMFSEERGGVEEDEEAEGARDLKVRAKQLYYQTLKAISGVMDNAKLGQSLRLKKSKRVVQGLIDQILTMETNLIGLTTIRSYDEYTYNHSVNVCILSIAIGHRVGLDRSRLCELGMAALFHDIGKADIPLEILNKPGEFSAAEWHIVRRHPVLGVKKMMELKGLDNLNSGIITGVFEHHIGYDSNGYPRVPHRTLSLFTRIISIADCYDALTSSRVYHRIAMPPDQALKFMAGQAGKAHDPLFFKLFVNCVGIYPIGTVLLLATGEVAVVVQNNPDPENWNMPMVKIIADMNGEEVDGETVDLTLGVPVRAISATLDPRHYNIDVSRYFV